MRGDCAMALSHAKQIGKLVFNYCFGDRRQVRMLPFVATKRLHRKLRPRVAQSRINCVGVDAEQMEPISVKGMVTQECATPM